MTRILSLGITDIGNEGKINEDTFQLLGRLCPDTLNGLEEKSFTAVSNWQVYALTDGLGGANYGDIAGRIAQQVLAKMSNELNNFDPDDFRFSYFIRDYVSQVQNRLAQRFDEGEEYGCSIAIALAVANKLYVYNLGHTAIYLLRDQKLFALAKPSRSKDYFGSREASASKLMLNITKLDLERNDLVLLMTRGIFDSLSNGQMKDILTSPDAFANRIRRLHQEARKFKPKHDISLIALSAQVDSLDSLVKPKAEKKRIQEKPISNLMLFLWSILLGLGIGVVLSLVFYLLLL